MSLRVLASGQCSLIVDLGRPRTRSLGVPVGGAADRSALSIGNALVGNPMDAAALEVCLVGPTLIALHPAACVVVGAPFELRSSRETLALGKTFTLEKDETLTVGTCSQGMRAYVCVHGGFESEMILGSRSALEPIKKGQVLECRPSRMLGRRADIERDWEAPTETGKQAQPRVLRIVPGPQAAWFEPSIEPVAYRVTAASNRMGLRLEGPPLALPEREMTSEPVCPGTVQVTREGQCIILGVDGQTIGGYPKLAQIISADIDLLGQLRPDEFVAFQEVTMEDAERIHARKRKTLSCWAKRWTEALRPI
jgi:biotin-dependent carboxylase-like uncharacterized protein